MARLPLRFAPFVRGMIQAAVTTGIATAIALHQWTDFSLSFIGLWSQSWVVAWLTMLPVVILCAPVIERAVHAMTEPLSSREKS
jgi:Protein of unknown function (DUF2798)